MSSTLNNKYNHKLQAQLKSSWKETKEEMLLLCVAWYVYYDKNYRKIEKIMSQRGFDLDRVTFFSLVRRYSSQVKKMKYEAKKISDWQVVERKIVIQGQDIYIYKAIDSQGNILDFLLKDTRDLQGSKRFFMKNLNSGKFIVITIPEDLAKVNKRNLKKKKKVISLGMMSMAVASVFSIAFGLNSLSSERNPHPKLEQKTQQVEPVYQEKISIKYNPAKATTALSSLSPQEKAFLDTIAWAEGTLHPLGYKTLFGGEIVDDLTTHPEKCITYITESGKKTCSTAFGRYQILDFNAKNMTSFAPQEQDKWAISKLEEIGALRKLKQGNLKEAIIKSCRVWASLTCYSHLSKGYYNQNVKSMKSLVAKYQERLKIYQAN